MTGSPARRAAGPAVGVRPHRIVVVAVGNPFASDDGVAHRVVAAAAPRLPDDVVRVAAHGEPARLVEAWSGADTAVVVDAVDGPGPAGDVTVLDGRALPAAGPVRRAHGSHALGVVEAVRLAEVLGRLPRRVVCVGVTGRRWDPGDELSPEVAAAVDTAADAVVRAVADAAAEVR